MNLNHLFGISTQTYTGAATARWPYLYGVELEVENVTYSGIRHIPDEDDEDYDDDYDSRGGMRPAGWTIHDDASLRRGLEFVTSGAQGGDTLATSIDAFYAHGLTYTSGPRTSTHIHVNMSDDTKATLQTLVALVYAIEDGIYSCVEESRKWGGYSVPLGEMRPARLRGILNPQTDHMFTSSVQAQRNNERYYGLNCNLNRHGTVEFRYFPGGPTKDELCSWIDLVTHIKKFSQSRNIQQFNASIPDAASFGRMLVEHFGEWAAKLLNARSAEFYYEKLQEVMTLAMDEENPERQPNVVFITPALLKFTNKTMLKEKPASIKYLQQIIPKGGVVGANDWQYYVMNAMNIPDEVPAPRASSRVSSSTRAIPPARWGDPLAVGADEAVPVSPRQDPRTSYQDLYRQLSDSTLRVRTGAQVTAARLTQDSAQAEQEAQAHIDHLAYTSAAGLFAANPYTLTPRNR